MFTLLKKRKDEDGVALIIAIIIIVIVGAIMTSLVMSTVTSSHKAIQNREWVLNGQSAESAVQNALAFINSPGTNCTGEYSSGGEEEADDSGNDDTGSSGNSVEDNPNCIQYYATDLPYHWKKGNDGNVNWQWRLESVTSGAKELYDVYALAYNSQKDINSADTRAIKVRLTYEQANGYKVDPTTNTVSYIPTQKNLFNWGAFGADSVEAYPGVKLDNVNKISGANSLATNGYFNFPYGGSTTMGINTLSLLNSGVNKATNRCRVNQNPAVASEICSPSAKILSNEDAGLDLSDVYQTIKKTCNGKESGGAWKASAHKDEDDGISYLTGGCYDSLDIDNNTHVLTEDGDTPTSDNPAKFYLTSQIGGYVQRPGTTIQGDDVFTTDSTTFQVYVAGQKAQFDNLTTTTATASKSLIFTGLIAGASATCYSSDPKQSPDTVKYAQNVKITGSLACKKVSLGANTNLVWDQSIADMQSDAKFTIWSTGNYESISKDTALGAEAADFEDDDNGGDGGDDSGSVDEDGNPIP